METIAQWSPSQLVRFILNILRQHPPTEAPTLMCDDLTATKSITVGDKLTLSLYQTTVGAAGGASALPATPKGYFRVFDYAGNEVLIPYYNKS